MESIETEICGACHPFYTGQEKTFDKVGQVQKFKDRMAKKSAKPKKKAAPRASKKTKKA